MEFSKEMVWEIICSQISEKNPSLAANLKKCSLIELKDGGVTIQLPDNGFTGQMIKREKNQVVLKQALDAAFKNPVRVYVAYLEEICDQIWDF